MATALQRDRLRSDIGATILSMPDFEADEIFDEAGESHTDTASITAATRVIALRRLLASSAKLTDYRQNQSSESLSDVFDHLKQLLAYWEGELDKATAAASATGAARFSGLRRRPKRVKEYPG